MPRLDWTALSTVVASRKRMAVLRALRVPATPSRVARHLKMPLPHVSRALAELRSVGAVKCLNPRRRKGRIYARTRKGQGLFEEARRLAGNPRRA